MHACVHTIRARTQSYSFPFKFQIRMMDWIESENPLCSSIV